MLSKCFIGIAIGFDFDPEQDEAIDPEGYIII